jgi:hypothetical protein
VVSEYQILDTGSKLKHCIITILKINMKTPYIYSNLSTYRARFKILVYEGGKNCYRNTFLHKRSELHLVIICVDIHCFIYMNSKCTYLLVHILKITNHKLPITINYCVKHKNCNYQLNNICMSTIIYWLVLKFVRNENDNIFITLK